MTVTAVYPRPQAEDRRAISATDRTVGVWGERTPFASGAEWPIRVDEHVVEEPERWVQSARVLCSNGCGMDIGVKDGRIVGVRGRAEDRINRGRLDPKSLYGWQANNSPERLTRPLIRREGELGEASWDEAMELIVARSRELHKTRPSPAPT
jgi:ferredoxin-nitrate reductase